MPASFQPLMTPGTFVLGCNYWASHAGTAMWSDWRPEEVERDLEQLAGMGLHVLRVFPLWPDFQPLHLLRGGGGAPREYRFGEEPLPSTEAGRAGVSEAALEKFQWFADCARRHGLGLSVGLLTGWMSGRLFVPPALEGRAIHTDPVALMWQVRFVRCFVRRFREHPAIVAWGPGNECNAMGGSRSREEAWVWSTLIADAIRAEDRSRPIVSGMHGLKPLGGGNWCIEDQGEIMDVLTTHPYPIFTPRCGQEPITGIRNGLHATAESCLYGDVGGRPCMVEEIGTLGPMFSSEQGAADYMRTVLFSSWAHDLRGLFWWCGYDQAHLEHAPYAWDSVEQELGLLRADRSAKPVATAFTAFRRFLDDLPFAALPRRRRDAVCLLSCRQDHWAVASSTFILAKQAGLEIEFATVEQPLPAADCYFLPGVTGVAPIPKSRWLALQRRVHDHGATAYLSCHDGLLALITDFIGAEFSGRGRRDEPACLCFSPAADLPELRVPGPVRLEISPTTAEVLAREPDGNPVLLRNRYGKGTVYFLAAAPELALAGTGHAFDRFPHGPWQRFYEFLANGLPDRRAARCPHSQVGLTEHALEDGRRVLVLINYSAAPVETELLPAAGWSVESVLYGAAAVPEWGTAGTSLPVRLPANDALVLAVAGRA